MTRKERTEHNCNFASFIDDSFISSWRQQLLSRRRFVLRAVATTAAVGAGLYAYNASADDAAISTSNAGMDDGSRTKPGNWNEHDLHTLSAVQNHLFPRGEDSPGAQDINALAYLQRALEDPTLAEDKQFIRNGVGWLDDLSVKSYEKTFLQLNYENREELLRNIGKSSAGENWLSTLLLYIFEALLTAPAYGGNPDGIGWTWLEHVPGFPLPAVDKVYTKLG